ncbi:iron ABC transporter permease, partial [Burkholderia sp. Ap-955]|nr:iron ABC transporter permease [Burkholderia sp. Ap-955]
MLHGIFFDADPNRPRGVHVTTGPLPQAGAPHVVCGAVRGMSAARATAIWAALAAAVALL